jgi:hypothetical protein
MFAKKKVTTELIEEYLDRYGWHSHQAIDESGEQRGAVVTGWKGPRMPEGAVMIIDPVIEKEVVTFTAGTGVTAPPDETPADRISQLMLTLLDRNRQLVMGGYYFNATDGTVGFKVGLPLATDALSYEDFVRCIEAILHVVEADHDLLHGIVAGTGGKTAPTTI